MVEEEKTNTEGQEVKEVEDRAQEEKKMKKREENMIMKRPCHQNQS